ncbi:MAG: class I SAM-dependent methyltransferase [Simkaniaceae bacterium]|nr:class I SAM-dependent methyltransferase [Simkaniaceae bacterium]
MRLFLLLSSCLLPIFAESSYALSTGEQDRERLIILNELYNPSTLSRLEITPGLRILTIGCGIALLELELAQQVGPQGSILATDISSDQLLIAEQTALAANIKNLQFMQLNVEDAGQIPGVFDRIHCRFVLSHLPLGVVEQVIPVLYGLLAPEGILVLEEIANLNSLTCEPQHIGYDKWKCIVQKQFAAQQSDVSPAERILEFLKKRGYVVFSYSYHPILHSQREKMILSLGVISVRDHLLKQGTVSSNEIEETIPLLEQLEQDLTILPRYCESSQIVVRQ